MMTGASNSLFLASVQTGGVKTKDSVILTTLSSEVLGVRIILKCSVASILTEETK